MHEMLDFLHRHSKQPYPAPAPKANSMSDSSSNSSMSDSGCSSADDQEPARRKQALQPATVASRAAEFVCSRVARCKKRSVDNMGYKRMCMRADTFLLGGLVCMRCILDNDKYLVVLAMKYSKH
eukprot:1043065-Pelagomonas_calceolata.AAC.1